MKLRRNRIVIDLGKARADQQGRVRAGRSRRAGRILGFIAVVLVVIVIGAAAGGFFWWRHYQTRPAYALALLVDAAQRNDAAEIDRLLDMDKITNDFVAQVRQRVTGASVAGGLAQDEQSIANSAPQLKPTVRDELIKEVQRLTERANGKPFPLVALAVPYFVEIKQDGNAASAETKLQDEQIKLMMQADAAGRWQIVAIEDDKLADLIADKVKKALPKSPSQWQDELERRLKGLSLPQP
jgi:flagellar basal body-associated protein FliL